MQHLDLVIFLRLSFRVELRFLRRRVELWGILLVFLTSSAPDFHCQASRTLNWGWSVSSYSISSSALFPSSSASLYCSLKRSRAFRGVVLKKCELFTWKETCWFLFGSSGLWGGCSRSSRAWGWSSKLDLRA